MLVLADLGTTSPRNFAWRPSATPSMHAQTRACVDCSTGSSHCSSTLLVAAPVPRYHARLRGQQQGGAAGVCGGMDECCCLVALGINHHTQPRRAPLSPCVRGRTRQGEHGVGGTMLLRAAAHPHCGSPLPLPPLPPLPPSPSRVRYHSCHTTATLHLSMQLPQGKDRPMTRRTLETAGAAETGKRATQPKKTKKKVPLLSPLSPRPLFRLAVLDSPLPPGWCNQLAARLARHRASCVCNFIARYGPRCTGSLCACRAVCVLRRTVFIFIEGGRAV